MCCTQLHLFVTHSLVAGGDLQFQESKKFKHNIYHLKGNSGIFKPEPSMQLPELMLATFPQNTDVFKMSFGAIFNLTLWQRCANGLLGKHVSAMYITNMRNVRFLSEISSFCQQIIPTTSLSGSFSEHYMRRLVKIKKCYSGEGAGSMCLDILVVNNLNYSGSTCSRSSHEICELKVKYRPSRSRWLLAPFGELHIVSDKFELKLFYGSGGFQESNIAARITLQPLQPVTWLLTGCNFLYLLLIYPTNIDIYINMWPSF